MKIVINAIHGGFNLSEKAGRELGLELSRWYGGSKLYVSGSGGLARDDARLVAIVEKFCDEASGPCARLVVVEIPDGVDWEIDEYDGCEWVSEKHRTWGAR